ncbi:MAG: FG-GAP repeat protein [Ahniella sp.]|nr:FG-GAP repeat protein [Ahniella sp.]
MAFVGDVNGDGFGDLAVGARQYDNDQSNEGAVFVFFGSGVLDTELDARLESNQGSGFVGNSVAGIGDINGDGFADIGAGANGFDVVLGNDGAAFVWFGGSNFNTVVDRIYEGDQLDGRLGTSIAGVGDVNNDGFDDFRCRRRPAGCRHPELLAQRFCIWVVPIPFGGPTCHAQFPAGASAGRKFGRRCRRRQPGWLRRCLGGFDWLGQCRRKCKPGRSRVSLPGRPRKLQSRDRSDGIADGRLSCFGQVHRQRRF